MSCAKCVLSRISFFKRPPGLVRGFEKWSECGAECSGRGGWRHGQGAFILEFPEEGAEFASHGDDGFVLVEVACFEPLIAGVEAVLSTPGEFAYFARLPLLPFAQKSADLGCSAVVLGAFHEHPAGV